MLKKTMTRTAVTILAAIIALFAAMPAHAGQTYALKGGYKVDVPKGFNQTEAKDNEVEFANKSGAFVNIEIDKNEYGDMTLKEIGKELKKGIKSGIKISSSGVQDLGSHKAYVMEGISVEDGVKVLMQFYVIKFKDYVFMMTCVCPAENSANNRAAFLSIAESIGKKK